MRHEEGLLTKEETLCPVLLFMTFKTINSISNADETINKRNRSDLCQLLLIGYDLHLIKI